MTVNDLAMICSLTIDLTRLRQNECKHLCIENFAPELFERLLRAFIEADRAALGKLSEGQ